MLTGDVIGRDGHSREGGVFGLVAAMNVGQGVVDRAAADASVGYKFTQYCVEAGCTVVGRVRREGGEIILSCGISTTSRRWQNSCLTRRPDPLGRFRALGGAFPGQGNSNKKNSVPSLLSPPLLLASRVSR